MTPPIRLVCTAKTERLFEEGVGWELIFIPPADSASDPMKADPVRLVTLDPAEAKRFTVGAEYHLSLASALAAPRSLARAH